MTPEKIRSMISEHRTRRTADGAHFPALLALADLVEEWLSAVEADEEVRHRMERGGHHVPRPTDVERLAVAERLSRAETALAKAVR